MPRSVNVVSWELHNSIGGEAVCHLPYSERAMNMIAADLGAVYVRI